MMTTPVSAAAALVAASTVRSDAFAAMMACRLGDPTLNEKAAAYQAAINTARAAQAALDATLAAADNAALDCFIARRSAVAAAAYRAALAETADVDAAHAAARAAHRAFN